VSTGQPLRGFLPRGIATVPDTAIGSPPVLVERYRRSVFERAPFRTAAPSSLRAQIGAPCALPGSGDGGV
jgi:hypothetical protein